MAADYTVKRHDKGFTIDLLLQQFNPTTNAWDPIPGLDTAPLLRLILKSGNTLVEGTARYGGNAGVVSYTWDSDDLAAVGSYRGELEITRLDGSVETVPNGGYFTVDIVEDLD